MKTCNCTMAQRLIGYGCKICQPEIFKDLQEMWIKDCRQIQREDMMFAIKGFSLAEWDENEPGAWDVLAEYFTEA